MQIIIKIAVGLLCILGVTELIWNIVLHLIRPKGKDRPVILIKLHGEAGEVEQKLRSADVVTRLIGGSGCDGLVAVDCGMNEEAREIAIRYCGPRENIVLCTPEDLNAILKK
ncbi:MAG: hypothetical protein ACI4QV_05350 [Acutalibacteraceae bacterium]